MHHNLRQRAPWRFGVWPLWVSLMSLAAPCAAELPPEAVRGKRIFTQGESTSGREITAYVGQASVPVPASSVPCRTCHGPDGLGRPEGGVVPSNITWSHLTKPYGSVSAHGRRFPPYDEAALARAVSTGVDAGSTTLSKAMPRYALDERDMADLIAYLKHIESDWDPGLGADRIVVGTVVPSGGSNRGLGEAVRRVLAAYFEDVNDAGGIYKRKLELVVASADSPSAVVDQAVRLVEEIGVFALVSSFTAGADGEFADLAEREAIPVIGSFTQFPRSEDRLPRYSFYLYSGLTDQGRALIQFASDGLLETSAPLAIVHARTPALTRVAEALEQHVAAAGDGRPVLRRAYPEAESGVAPLVEELKTQGAAGLVFLGAGDAFSALTAEAAGADWFPYVLVSGSVTGRDVFAAPRAFQNRLYAAYPTVPADHTEDGRREFNDFHHRHALGQDHVAAQISAYASATVLVEALKGAGRNLSRARLVSALEGLYNYETGLTPKITYGANRHVGALGAHVLALDLETRRFAEAQWVVPK